jgi:hypothetical protein
MKSGNPMKRITSVVALLLIFLESQAQVDPVLQQENLSGTNNINKLRTVLDWSGLALSSNIPKNGAITNNGQIISTAATGFQYGINYFIEAGYNNLGGSGTAAFKYDYSGSASYGTGTPKQAALNYGAVCSSLQVCKNGTYRMEVTNIAGGAVPLQFSIIDLDQSEQIQIEGYQGATYVAATLQLRSSLAGAPVITNNGVNMQVKAGFATNQNDFLETSVVDVYFLTPVDKVVIRQTVNAVTNGYTLFTNFKAISSVDVVKWAGTVNATSVGSPTIFEVPYTIKVANKETRGLNLNSLQVSENLYNPFPVPAATSVAIKAGSFSVSAPVASGIAINPLFNGTSNFALLNGTGVLKPGETATINFIVIVTYPNKPSVPSTARNNQVHTSGLPYNSAGNAGGSYSGSNWTGPANAVSVDSSTNSATTPAIANGDTPNPTPVYFSLISLPVRWVAFSGELADNKVQLHWTAAAETGNDFYIIEKSFSGSNWIAIGTIASKGNSGAPQNYLFTDVSLYSGTCYYRIKQTNTNGTYTYSAAIQIKSGAEISTVSLYPNPATDQAWVKFQNTNPGIKIACLYTQAGVLLDTYAWDARSGHEIFTLSGFSALRKGIYILIIQEKTGQHIAAEKIIKH